MTGLAEEYSFLFTRRYSGLSFNTLCRSNMLSRCVQTASLLLLKMTESSKVGVTPGSGKTLPTHFRSSLHSTYSVIAAPRRPHGSSAEAHITSWPTLVVMWRGSSSSWQWRKEALASVRQSSICRVTYSWRSRSSCSNSTSTADKEEIVYILLCEIPGRSFRFICFILFAHLGQCWYFLASLAENLSPAPQLIPKLGRLHQKYQRSLLLLYTLAKSKSMCVPARTEALVHHKLGNDNILTRKAGISLVVTFHTSPPGWRRHLREVFSDHLDHGTLFLLGSVCASSVIPPCAVHHPKCSVWSAAVSPWLWLRVSSMYELRLRVAAALRFYRLHWSRACVGGANRFRQESSRFEARATQAGVAPLTCNSEKHAQSQIHNSPLLVG